MKTFMTLLLGLAVALFCFVTPQTAEAGGACFQNQFQVQQVAVPQRVVVRQQVVQPRVQRVVVRQPRVQRVVVSQQVAQPVFVGRQRFVQRQRLVGGNSTIRNLGLIGVFGNDVQRFSAIGTGLGF